MSYGHALDLKETLEYDFDEYMLTRYACYLIAEDGDPRKEQVKKLNKNDYTIRLEKKVEVT